MIGDAQIHVYQAGQTTLFVTNFPEKTDDESIRSLFSKARTTPRAVFAYDRLTD